VLHRLCGAHFLRVPGAFLPQKVLGLVFVRDCSAQLVAIALCTSLFGYRHGMNAVESFNAYALPMDSVGAVSDGDDRRYAEGRSPLGRCREVKPFAAKSWR